MKYDFVNLSSNKTLRLLTAPYQYWAHTQYYRAAFGGNPHRQKLGCTYQIGDCPLCSKGMEPSKRFLVAALERESNCIKLIDIDSSICEQMRVFVTDPFWGDPIGYDIKWHAPERSITTNPKKPLTAAEEELKNSICKTYLNELCRPNNACLQRLVKFYADKNHS